MKSFFCLFVTSLLLPLSSAHSRLWCIDTLRTPQGSIVGCRGWNSRDSQFQQVWGMTKLNQAGRRITDGLPVGTGRMPDTELITVARPGATLQLLFNAHDMPSPIAVFRDPTHAAVTSTTPQSPIALWLQPQYKLTETMSNQGKCQQAVQGDRSDLGQLLIQHNQPHGINSDKWCLLPLTIPKDSPNGYNRFLFAFYHQADDSYYFDVFHIRVDASFPSDVGQRLNSVSIEKGSATTIKRESDKKPQQYNANLPSVKFKIGYKSADFNTIIIDLLQGSKWIGGAKHDVLPGQGSIQMLARYETITATDINHIDVSVWMMSTAQRLDQGTVGRVNRLASFNVNYALAIDGSTTAQSQSQVIRVQQLGFPSPPLTTTQKSSIFPTFPITQPNNNYNKDMSLSLSQSFPDRLYRQTQQQVKVNNQLYSAFESQVNYKSNVNAVIFVDVLSVNDDLLGRGTMTVRPSNSLSSVKIQCPYVIPVNENKVKLIVWMADLTSAQTGGVKLDYKSSQVPALKTGVLVK